MGEASRPPLGTSLSTLDPRMPKDDRSAEATFDRRLAPRRAVRHVGVIQTEPTAPRQYCMVTEASDGGVRIIYTAANLEPPSEFTLWFADTEGKYRVVWHK